MKTYTYLDLFSGPGGLCTGFKNANFKPLIAVEFEDNTVETYAANHNAEILKIEELLENKGKLEKVLADDDRTCLIHGDIRQVTNEIILEILLKKFNTNKVDVVAGGPPCESFSLAGDRKEDDERNDLFSNMLRIAHCVESKFLFFENVIGLLSKKRNGKKGGQFEYIIKKFEEEHEKTGNRYILASKDPQKVKLLAADYGVPQKRERIFLVGCNSKYGDNPFNYPKKTHDIDENIKSLFDYEQKNDSKERLEYVTVEEAFYDLPPIFSGEGDDQIDYKKIDYRKMFEEGQISKSHYEYLKFIRGDEGYIPEHIDYNKEKITFHKAVNHRKRIQARFSFIKQGEGLKNAGERLISEGREMIRNKWFPKKLYNARNRRLKSNEPSFTVTSHCLDEMVHPTFHRQITPREAARLQTFPDWYIFKGSYVEFHGNDAQDKYEQIGDAIPVLLVKALAGDLYQALEKLGKTTKKEIVI
ncbi:DNA cytosine methyltransferase [Natroniella acetigena]|uniref:DNA cytosine methyltransferase n=1 Tax=Natroniella acetigena TaxID=52004 RepID=UPI00200B026E|nr:DNA cytosine methyltransferase [Natroniella acetigena]MCK8827077.1 DNA cytosine methyltransferase [Natroniella acetigena]